jgi:tetratricopeptide (TPR) repeat protein
MGIDDASGTNAPDTAELLSCLRLLEQIEDGSLPTDVRRAPLATTPPAQRPSNLAGDSFPMPFGRFQLRGLLGAGGFGAVFRAFDADLDREVALKIPRLDVAALPSLQARFVRESQAAAALDHPGIISVFETGRVGPVAYISTALCNGPTLTAWLAAHAEPVSPSSAVELVRQLAEAVQHAHDRGVLHRDLKPSNVLLEPHVPNASALDDFRPRITDFGLAKRLEVAEQATKDGALLGTPRYMAPEQASGSGEAISVRTDVYALGVILYELLTGAPPFVGDSDAHTMAMIIDAEPSPPRRSGGRIARDLAAICLTCLRKDPAERYRSAQGLADDLGRFLRGEPVSARPLSPLVRLVRWRRRHPLVAGLAALLFAVTIAGVVAVAWQWRRAEAGLANARTQTQRARQQLNETELLLVNMAWLLDDLARYRQPTQDAISLDLHADLGRQFYEVLSRHRQTEASPVLTAVAELQQGRLAGAAEDNEAARRRMQSSLAIWKGLLTGQPSDMLSIRAAAMTLYHYGNLLAKGGHRDAALSHFDGDLLLGQISIHDEVGMLVAEEYVRFLNAEAELSFALERYELAETSFLAAAAVSERMSAAAPSDVHARRLLSNSLRGVAVVRRRLGDRTAALAACDSALDALRPFPEIHNAPDAMLKQLTELTRQRAMLLRDLRERERAVSAFREAYAFVDELASRRPDDLEPRAQLARLTHEMTRVLTREKRYEEAIAVARRNLQTWRDIAERRPLTAAEQRGLGVAHSELAGVAIEVGDEALAKDESELALAALDLAAQREVEDRNARVVRAACHSLLSGLDAAGGDAAKAIQHLEVAIDVLEPMAARRPKDAGLALRLEILRKRLDHLRAQDAPAS